MELLVSFFQRLLPHFLRLSLRDIGIVLGAGLILAAPIYIQSRDGAVAVATTAISMPDLLGIGWQGQNAGAVEREKQLIISDATIDLARRTLARDMRASAPQLVRLADEGVERLFGLSPLSQWNMLSIRAFRDALAVAQTGPNLLTISFKSADQRHAQRGSRIVADLYVSSRLPVASIASQSRIGGAVPSVIKPTELSEKPQANVHFVTALIAGVLGVLACGGVVVTCRFFEPAEAKNIFGPASVRGMFASDEERAQIFSRHKTQISAPSTQWAQAQPAPPPTHAMRASFMRTPSFESAQTQILSAHVPAPARIVDDVDELHYLHQLCPELNLAEYANSSDGEAGLPDQMMRRYKPPQRYKNHYRNLTLVTSLLHDDAGLISALYVGHSLAMKKRVVFVELDPHARVSMTGLGVSDYVLGDAHFEEIIHPLEDTKLHMIPYGHRMHASCHEHDMFDHFIIALTKTYDNVILHVPSVEQSDMAMGLAHYAHLVLVCTHEKNKKRALRSKIELLRSAGAHDVLGVCASNLKPH